VDLNSEPPQSAGQRKVAVAISGGGYRASAWGLGVLWALVGSGVNSDVTMMSSVSGGSLTNAYAAQGTPFRTYDSATFDEAARKLADRLAGRPLFFALGLGGTLIAAAAGIVSAAMDCTIGVLGAAALVLVFAVVGALGSKDLLCNRFETWLYVDVLLAIVGFLAWAWPSPWLVAAGVVALGLCALGRGPLVGWSFGRSLRHLTGNSDSTLGGMNPEPLHVILATELRAGHHACFARDFIYCYDLGLGRKPSLPVRVAVQASANFPGAFPTRWIRTAGMDFIGGDHHVNFLATTDGGVYDNMADQWPIGLPDRIARLRDEPAIMSSPERQAVLDELEQRAPTFVVVANASGALDFRSVGRAAIPLIGELLGLLQTKDVLYDNGTSVRRKALIDKFDRDQPSGTLIHIASTPDAVTQGMDPHGDPRIRDVLDYIERWGDNAAWRERARAATAVGTQLWPVGREKTHNVITCAYVQTVVNLHVKRLTDELPEPPRW
jgi:hypothetical protein